MHWNLKCAQLLFLRLLPKVVIQMSRASYNIQITPHHWIFGHILVPTAHHHKHSPPRLRLRLRLHHHITRLGNEMLCVTILVFSRHQKQPAANILSVVRLCDSVTFALQNFRRPVWTKSRTSNGFNFCRGWMSSRYRVDCMRCKMI